MDFGVLPPEINSARMYIGAGAGPMMAVATAWNGLAVELSTTASSVESVITQLATEQWLGPASMAMTAAAQLYLDWLAYTAECAQYAGSQALASAAAFEAAFAATVPPAEITVNRALLAALVATNVLGQNLPMISATETQYAQMWAQDALAMYGYAASSAVAGTLNPLLTPLQTINPAGLVGQAAASNTIAQGGLGNLITNLPNSVMEFASPLAPAAGATGLSAIIQDIEGLLGVPFMQNAINGAINTGAWFTMAGACNAALLGDATSAAGAAVADVAPAVAGVAGLARAATSAGFGGVLAGMGGATTVGSLSVPASWFTAAPALTAGATALEGSGWAVPEEAGLAAGMPGIAAAAKGVGSYAGPRYGFKPIIMPKQIVV